MLNGKEFPLRGVKLCHKGGGSPLKNGKTQTGKVQRPRERNPILKVCIWRLRNKKISSHEDQTKEIFTYS